MKYLILTAPEDTHALAVKIVLEELGHVVRFLFMADQPTKLKNSVFIDNDTYHWCSSDKQNSVADNEYDVVWWRRARKPHVPKEITHPDDHSFALNENRLLFESITDNLAPNATWINPKNAAVRAQSKLFQLRMAVATGMKIPTTLCSNDPQDIRYFLLKNEAEGVIYKPLCANFWFEAHATRISYTSRLSFQDLPTNKLLQLTPGIFQKEIRKKYELRVVYFGGYIIAAKLNSQAHPNGKLDWRAISARELNVEQYFLPESLEEQIKTFMEKMGLVFGSLDFIVNEEGETIFLEVNEQGQFLWIEEANPDLKILDVFIQFITNFTKPFQWEPKKTAHRLHQHHQHIMSMMQQNMRYHISLNTEKGVQ
ncbi:MAG: hypothetical protein NTW94_05240 [Legionellales bacterium]|nr:hypothetical protein [Legionellales bacterium]